MIYILVLLLMLFGIYKYDYRRAHGLYFFFYGLIFVILVCISGLRYRIGTDSIVYENYYEEVPKLWELFKYKFDKTRFEPGFVVFESITRSISPDFILAQFFETIVVNLVVFWFILKFAVHRFLALLLYFIILYFTLNMQVMREALAVSCFLLAWPSFRDGRWLGYYALTLLASTFHSSAFLTLLFPLCCIPGIRELFVFGKRTLVISVLILAIGIYIQARFKIIFSMMAFTERLMDRVNEYSGDAMSGSTFNIAGIIGFLLQYCVYPGVALYFVNKLPASKFRLGGVPKKGLLKKWILKLMGRSNPNDKVPSTQVVNPKHSKYDRWNMMVVISIYLMAFSLPMFIFTRYFNYMGMFCIVTISTWAFTDFKLPSGKILKLKFASWMFLLAPYIFLFVNIYLSPANRSGTLKTYEIYYPYASRLDPETDTHREAIYRYWNAR